MERRSQDSDSGSTAHEYDEHALEVRVEALEARVSKLERRGLKMSVVHSQARTVEWNDRWGFMCASTLGFFCGCGLVSEWIAQRVPPEQARFVRFARACADFVQQTMFVTVWCFLGYHFVHWAALSFTSVHVARFGNFVVAAGALWASGALHWAAAFVLCGFALYAVQELGYMWAPMQPYEVAAVVGALQILDLWGALPVPERFPKNQRSLVWRAASFGILGVYVWLLVRAALSAAGQINWNEDPVDLRPFGAALWKEWQTLITMPKRA